MQDIFLDGQSPAISLRNRTFEEEKTETFVFWFDQKSPFNACYKVDIPGEKTTTVTIVITWNEGTEFTFYF